MGYRAKVLQLRDVRYVVSHKHEQTRRHRSIRQRAATGDSVHVRHDSSASWRSVI